MSATSLPSIRSQADQALYLLADLYHRRFQKNVPSDLDRCNLARWHANERIRNTLSHEMFVIYHATISVGENLKSSRLPRCHLASWIINGDPKEGHGRIFKAWYDTAAR